MASRRPARLHQKTAGIFCIRVLFRQKSAGNGPENSKQPELGKSLRTKDAVLAHRIPASLNARSEGVKLHQRLDAMKDFSARTISPWTLSADITCSDVDDQRRLTTFLEKYPILASAD